MKIPRIYTEQPLSTNQTVSLSNEASKYIAKVLRRTVGTTVELFNGDGMNYAATLVAIGKETRATVTGHEFNPTESPLHISLVQALAKGAKLDLVIQKATELGVNRITPISNDRSVLRIEADRVARKMQHWKNISISACAQCQRSSIPVIDPPQDFTSWLKTTDPTYTFLLHPNSAHSFGNIELPNHMCTIVIGPEGGFSAQEHRLAVEHGVQLVRCGPRVLRTETAGFTAIAIMQSRFGDLR